LARRFHSLKLCLSSKYVKMNCITCQTNFKGPKNAKYCTNKCRPSNLRAGNLWRSYKITLEDYNKMFDAQKGLCLGCYKHQSEFNYRLYVDHCHKTGRVRGLLCSGCNRALGGALDNSETLRRLADYLGLNTKISL
jgi:hypothetical protein